MQCPTCLLRYNVKLRQPKVITCGHTICQSCLKIQKKCKLCGILILVDKNYALNFSLMEIIEKDIKEIDKYIKVCFVGSSTTGKTTLIKRLMGCQFTQETVATIGYDFSFQDKTVDNLQIRYQLWDSAGQQKYRAISPIHYKNSDIVVIVYDITQSSFDNRINYWIEQALKNSPQDVKIIIVGNKLDLAQQNRAFKSIDDQTWRQIQNQGYFHTQISCKTGLGVDQFWNSLDNILRDKLTKKRKSSLNYQKQLEIIEKRFEKVTKIKKNSNSNSSRNNNTNSSCC